MEKWRGNLLVTLKAGEVGFSRLEKKLRKKMMNKVRSK